MTLNVSVLSSGLRIVILGRVIRMFHWVKVGQEHRSIARYIRSKVSVTNCAGAYIMWVVVWVCRWWIGVGGGGWVWVVVRVCRCVGVGGG